MTADLEAMPSTPPERLEDPPIVLRRYRGGDLQALFEAVSTSTDHLSPWLAWASVEPLEQGLGDFIAHSIDAFDRGDNYDYAIWDLAESTLVGGAGLHPRLDPGRIEIGYWVRAGWLRRGIASAAARALTTAAFQLTGMQEVHIHCDEANVASAGVPRGLGFRLLRTIEDEADAPAEVGRSMEWAITVSEWNSAH
jgi:RimJ/RimL family protein N-acetyltransferase